MRQMPLIRPIGYVLGVWRQIRLAASYSNSEDVLGRKYRVGSGQTAVDHGLGRMVKILEVKWHRKYARVKWARQIVPATLRLRRTGRTKTPIF